MGCGFRQTKENQIILDSLIPEFFVRLGGATSIDVTKLGIDKAYGIKKLKDILGIPLKEMIYVGTPCFQEETTTRLNRRASFLSRSMPQ